MSDAPGSEELLKRTFLTLKKTQSRLAELESARSEPIAIVGMACRFPGGSSDPEKLWQFLERGGNANAPVPPERWEASRFYDPSPDATGKTHAARAHFLSESIDGFDAPFFGISAKEAISLDPQQRLLLEVTWEALEDAGIDSRSLRGSQTGVYVGISADDYTQAHRHSGRPDLIDAYALTGTCFAPAAGRISYTFGFEGPSMAIDTACSSSLVAVHLAAQSLRSRESDLALAAGVNLILSPIFHISSTRLGTISPDGQCKTFDASADGYGRGEGCGVVLLKRLSDALAAGDRIHALLRGSAVNQDGRSNGLTAPNGLAQEKVIQRALANAGVLPADVDYIEVHGTGTPLGDPIEVESIGRIMRNVRTNADPVRLSTIKTNIGHLEAGAGVAGLIKTIQCLRHEAIPPHLHLKNPSAHIPWDQYPISVSREGTPWPRGPRVRRAGVSSFGFSGTNAHVVLEEAPPMAARRNDETRPLHVLPISARSAEGLEELKGRYVELLETSDEPIADICFTAGAGRTHFAHRLAVKGATTADVLRALRETNGSSAHNRPRIAFLFTGQGSQYAGMGRTLYESEPRFRAAFDECAAHFDGELVALLYGASASDDELRQTRFTQPAIFAVEYALAKLWASWGVEPDLLCGHSIGEYAAAVIGGVLSVADAMRLVTARGRLMQALPDGGAMAAVAATAREVEPFLDGTEVAIAAINAPADVVLSGPAAEVARICEALRARNIASQPLRVSHAFHSTLMDPMIDAFRTVASNVDYRSAQLPIVSTVTGRKASANELSNADYWTRQIGATVRFADAASALAAEGADVMLEIGAMPILTGLAAKTLGEGTYLPSLTRRDDEWKRMLTTLAALYTRGVEVDWRAFDAPWNRVRVALPSYPFQRKSYYLQPIVDSASGHITEHHPYLGQRIESPRVVLHETTFTSAEPAFLKEHQIFGRIISPAAAHVSMALAATGTSALEDVAFTAPLVIDDGERRTVQTIVDREAGTFELLSRGGAQWISHCTGRIGTMVPASNPLPPDVQRRCTDAMSHDDFYALIERAGYSTGPNFQCVATIAKGEDEALCSVTPTVTIDDGAIHPGLIDSVLQTVLPACDRSASQMLTGDSVLIPLHMGAVRVHRSLASGLLCHTRVSVASGHVKCTIRGYDPTGELALEIDDFLLKQTDRATLYRELRTEDRSLLYTTEWIETTKSGGDERPDYLIFGEHGWVDAISATLRERGSDCVEAVPGLTLEEIAPSRWALDPLAPAQVGELLTNWLRERNGPARIVFLWNGAPAAPELRTASAIEEQERFLCSALLNVVHALTANPSARLWVVTQNAQAVLADDPPADAVPATLWGFGRAIAGESPELWGGLVDVEKTRSATSVATLVSVLDRGAGEQQLAIRKGSAYAARLMHAARPARKTTPRDGYYLATGARHTLDDLSFQPRPRVAPAAHEVEVEIHAAGLNFRDVLNALGQYPGEAGLMGFEAVGIVTAAGSDVTRLKAGDAVIVMAAPGCIGSFITVDARFVLPKPASMTFEEAVTLPATFLTAWYALHILGRISSKDRILIHAAAGGVGLAALQIARAAGAEVFATAGSNEKRDYVRSLLGSGGVDHVMSSRTLDFANELAQRTHGAGVTMVLNSLNGEFIARSFEVLAPHGRFLEMGKIGIWDEERVRAHDATIEYHPFDLAAVSRENPELILNMWDDVLELFAAGTFQPLPTVVFPMRDAEEAFRYMAQARHIGKIVLSRAEEIRQREPLVRNDATYLITGGLGALGIVVAQWLAEEGARHLVLTGRGAPDARASAAIDTLRANGVDLQTVRANVAHFDEVENLVARISTNMPPLRGVIHAAGVLDDGMLADQSWERFRRVMEPKVLGAWNLHQATRLERLDLFVCFSSIAAIIGNLGQANYAAANAFLDTLAASRRKLGLAATSINWGPWAQGGMAASLGDERFTAQGIRFLDPEGALRAMQVALQDGLTQCVVADVDWQTYAGTHGIEGNAGLFAGLIAPSTKNAPASKAPKRDIVSELRAALPVERRGLLQTYLQALAREVLGYGESEVISADRPLVDQGFDSLMTVDMRNRLGKNIGAALPASLLFDHPTLERIVDYLLRDVIRIGDAAAPVATAPTADALLQEIDHLVNS